MKIHREAPHQVHQLISTSTKLPDDETNPKKLVRYNKNRSILLVELTRGLRKKYMYLTGEMTQTVKNSPLKKTLKVVK